MARIPRCRYCVLIRSSDPGYRARPARHSLSSQWPRCDKHWRFVCASCGKGRHFNAVSFCERASRFFCISCARGNRARRGRFWKWDYHHSLRCPWHPHWLPALDFLEHEGRHPWQLDRALAARRTGLDPEEVVPEHWYAAVRPASSLTSRGSRMAWERVADFWVSRYSAKGDINREWVTDPVLLRWLGPVRGLRVLDAGCGNGYLARILARRGARVTAVEQSARLLARAEAAEKMRRPGIRYLLADLSRLGRLPARAFDLAVANHVLQDVRDLRGAVREIARVLSPGGRFIACITHPCFEAPAPAVKRREPPDSQRDEDWTMTVDRYFDRVAVWWGWPGAPPVAGYHRPLRDYFDALARAGLLVSRLEEPLPRPLALKVMFRQFADLLRVPNYMLVEAVKPPRRG